MGDNKLECDERETWKDMNKRNDVDERQYAGVSCYGVLLVALTKRGQKSLARKLTGRRGN